MSNEWLCPVCHYQPVIVAGQYAFDPDLSNDELGFNQISFERLFELEAGNFWFRSKNKLIIWLIKKYFKAKGKMLEIGCGTGYVLSGIKTAIPDLQLIGSDVSSKGLAYAKKRLSDVEMVQFDATSIPNENEFDIIGCFDVLEHTKEEQEVLKQINKALVAGGG